MSKLTALHRLLSRPLLAFACSGLLLSVQAHAMSLTPTAPVDRCAWTSAVPNDAPSSSQLASRLQPGDLVFIRVTARPFLEVADATGSWTNHVGIVVPGREGGIVIAESTFPRARRTAWPDFLARSEAGRVAVMRPVVAWTPERLQALQKAVDARDGTFYDTGFDLNSSRQFCSRYVREVLKEASGLSVGEVRTFAELLTSRPDARLGFWRLWYLGHIPWSRQTVTPASVLASAGLVPVFDGQVAPGRPVLTAPSPSH